MGARREPSVCGGCGAEDTGQLSRECGVSVCWECGHHEGLARCYCGWSRDGGDGRAELIEMGETIEEDY